MDWGEYDPEGFFDEAFEALGRPRASVQPYLREAERLGWPELTRRAALAESMLYRKGVTFSVKGDAQGTEKILPFDTIPRTVGEQEWARLDAGLKQRVRALNAFINDVYHQRRAVKDGIIPAELISSCQGLMPALQGWTPPLGVWCHITGTDLVRDGKGAWHVLEDNLRCPSGVSYVLVNRELMKRVFPAFFEQQGIRPVEEYSERLLGTLRGLSPKAVPQVALLTPGPYNSAYFEHAFLAQQMGAQLVQASDLRVDGDELMMLTTRGWTRVDVLYRRVDDAFLDPLAFRADSLVGVPGLMRAVRAGKLALANAPGTGVADDKAVYAYVPALIRYYLSEEPIIPNVETFVCWDEAQRSHVLANLGSMVVKAVAEAGGYGMLVGPHSTKEQQEEFRQKIIANPRNYIGQPTLSLSRVPTMTPDGKVEGRHVDLRPYILYGKEPWVMPGGLTRVALRKGSLVVNSSQGGGSKDTWVLSSRAPQPAEPLTAGVA